jgi:hypothetical protein
VGHIDSMYFALGRDAFFSRSADYQRIRHEMQGRLMQLDSSQAANNAFLMVIGDYVFIEFGQRGNACHVFRQSSSMPFALGQSSVSDTRRDLKNETHPAHVRTLRHRDKPEEWENKFAKEINGLISAKPSDTVSGARHTLSSASPVQAQSNRQVPMQFSWQALANFTSKHGLKIEDLRPKNGNLWVCKDDRNPEVNHQLEFWGFKYRPSRGWWRE